MQSYRSGMHERAIMEIERYLRPTDLIDSDTESIKKKAKELTHGVEDGVGCAQRLFYFVRDGIKYNIYAPKDSSNDFRASATLVRGEGYCVQKAILLAALARAAGIPARVGFAIIRNYALPQALVGPMQNDILPWHGYVQLYLEGRWIKATPAFDKELCEKKRFISVEFDGRTDAMLPAYTQDGQPHIEYLNDRGIYDEIPLDLMWQAMRERGLLK
jgi:transglutaminase-like putative cysteine protease